MSSTAFVGAYGSSAPVVHRFNRRSVFLKHLPVIQALSAAVAAKKWQEVLAHYEKLPPALRKEKTFLLSRAQAFSLLGEDAQYLKAIDELVKAHPGDMAAEMLAIDGYFLKKKHKASLLAIDRLDERVGGDPYLQVIRANVYLTQGKREECKAALASAVKQEPTLQQPYWTLISLAMEEERWEETAKWLTAVERDAGVTLADLSTLPEYQGFMKSAHTRSGSSALLPRAPGIEALAPSGLR